MDIVCEILVKTTSDAVTAAEAIARNTPTKPNWEVVVALKAALRDLQSAHVWAMDAKRPTEHA